MFNIIIIIVIIAHHYYSIEQLIILCTSVYGLSAWLVSGYPRSNVNRTEFNQFNLTVKVRQPTDDGDLTFTVCDVCLDCNQTRRTLNFKHINIIKIQPDQNMPYDMHKETSTINSNGNLCRTVVLLLEVHMCVIEI